MVALAYMASCGNWSRDTADHLRRREEFLLSPLCHRLMRARMTSLVVTGPPVPDTWLPCMQSHASLEDAQRIALGHAPEWADVGLKDFITTAHALGLSREPLVPETSISLPHHVNVGFNEKKQHEVERMAAFVASWADQVGSKVVVDIGSGKGYLGQALCVHYGLDVIGVEAELSHNQSTKKRVERITGLIGKARQRDLPSEIPAQMKVLTQRLTPSSPIDDSLREACKGALVVALHACGDLTPMAMKLFAETDATALIAVGCCYNKVTEACFPLGNTLQRDVSAVDLSIDGELACHATEGWAKRDPWRLRSHGYRALLEQLFQSNDIAGQKQIGRLRVRLQEEDSFEDYAWKIIRHFPELNKASVHEEVKHLGSISTEVIATSACIYALRLLIANVAETLVLLDRLEYLSDSASLEYVDILPLFDPAISPRNNCLVAARAQASKPRSSD